MQRDLRHASAGAIGGLVATLPMSAVMIAAQRAGLMGEMPPRKITEAALEAAAADDDVPSPATDALTVAVHFGFGAVSGAVFGLVHGRLPRFVPGVPHGMVFGALVWAGSYMGWVPALGIMPSVPRDRTGRPESMVVAHLVFGAVLGAVVERLTRRDRR